MDALDLGTASQMIVEWARADRGRAVHLCNAYTLSLAHRDPSFAEGLNRADLNLMDGMPLVWIARRLGFRPALDRVYGPDLMLDVMRRGRSADVRHFLYGSTPNVTEILRRRLEATVPGVAIVGAQSPPFRDLTPEEETEFENEVRRCGADIAWVGLGTPKQDRFIERFRERVPATLIAVGAAFDFHAGTKRQAPGWMRRTGLEWMFRLANEPRRLWRRYLVGNTIFVIGALRTTRRGERELDSPHPEGSNGTDQVM